MRPLLITLAASLAITAPATFPAAGQTSVETFVPPPVEDAPIAYLLDLSSGQVLFEREADRRFMPASITKVMTTYLAFEWMEQGKVSPEQIFAITPETWRAWNNVGSTMFLPHNARVSVDDLVHGVTTVSANDGAAMLAVGAAGSIGVWVDAMNAMAKQIGMRDSHFGTANGWMDEGRTFVTARDLSTLASAMIARHPGKYRHYVGHREFTYRGITQPNHDPISGYVAGADGIKTGFTNQSGYGFLGTAERDGRRLILVVAASPNNAARRRASRDLLEWGFSAFEHQRVYGPQKTIASANVQDGDAAKVALVAPGGVFLDRPRGKSPDVEMEVRYEGPLIAPIRQGEEIARLHVSIDGMSDYSIPLTAAHAVEKAGVLDRVWNGVRGLFT